jgi:serine/threonine protein kinase
MDGLSCLYQSGLCHGDLTLKNLLLTAKGIVKLSDYGFQKQMFLEIAEVRQIDNRVKDTRDAGY